MAQWVEFTSAYDHYDNEELPRSMKHFPKGSTEYVPADLAERALAKGAARPTEKPEHVERVTAAGSKVTRDVQVKDAAPGG